MSKPYADLLYKYTDLWMQDEPSSIQLYGIECGLGWYDLIEETLEKIKNYPNRSKKSKLFQIKEKFGRLTIYYDAASEKERDDIEIILSEVYRKSSTICEKCGLLGTLKGYNGWYRTLCEKHDAEMVIKDIIE